MKTNQRKAGVALSYLSIVIHYAIVVIYTPIMLRLLGQSEYGLYNLVASLLSNLGLLNFGFGSAYMRYYSYYRVGNDQENIAKLNGMFTVVFFIMGFIVALAGVIFVFKIELILGKKFIPLELSIAKFLISIMIFNILLAFPASIFECSITANEEFIFQKLLQTFRMILSPFIILPILLMGYGSIGMVITTTVFNVFVIVSNAIFCFKKLNIKFIFNNFDFSLVKEVMIFSSYIFINIIIDQINWNVDKYILGIFHGTTAVAVYGLAAQINAQYLSLSNVISHVFKAKVNQIVAANNDNKALTRLFTRIGRIQFMILSLIFSGFILFGHPFINMWAGSSYNKSYPIILLLILPVTVPLIQNIGVEIQRAKNMHQFSSLVYLFIAIGNLSLSIPLAKLYGGIGSALGTSISILVGPGFIMNWYYHNKIGIDIKYFWKQIFEFIPPILPALIIGISMSIFIDLYNIIPFLLCSSIYTFIFCASLWFLGMNQYEKKLFGEPVLTVLKKLKK